MTTPLESWTDVGSAIVSAGGNDAPVAGTVETLTVTVSVAFPVASPTATPWPTDFYAVDPLVPGDYYLVTSCPGGTGAQSWTVTRGADGSTPQTHTLPFTLQEVVTGASLRGLQNRGLLFLSGGGTVTLADIQAAQSAGYTGLWLDPKNIWDMTGLVLNGIQNFEFYMGLAPGSIGWNAHVSAGPGYIKTDTGGSPPADGIQVYASAPSTSQTQGIIFRNCIIKGSNSNATLHFGGGQRACGVVDSLIWNPGTAANSYALITDCQLSANNSEDMIFSWTGGGGVAGGWAAIGIDTNSSGAHANDTVWHNPRTSGGTYSVVKASGGGHTFIGAYDRSNPSTACYQNNGGTRWLFIGGEDQNTSGQSHIVAGGTTILESRAVTVTSGGATSCSVSSGKLQFRGNCQFNTSQVLAISGTGTADLSEVATDYTNLSVSGSAGLLVQAPSYPEGARPTVTSWTGPLTNISGQKIPRDVGLLAWTADPDLVEGATFTPVTTTIYLCEFWTYETQTLSNIAIHVQTTPTLTSGNFLGVYSPGSVNFTQLGVTADQTTPWGTTGVKPAAFTSAIPNLAPGRYYVALLVTGTTLTNMVRALTGVVTQLGNVNVSGANLRCMTAGTGATLPPTLAVSGFATSAPVFGAVMW